MQWTSEQRAAIEGRGNLIVSAAAGAGKTAVLTERICRLVDAGTPVERLLVLTFTRAAAAEMKQRIEARLRRMAEAAEAPERRRYLNGQSLAVERAHISTIDSFCGRVVKRHGHLCALSPDARVGDEAELAGMAETALDTVLTERAAADDAGLRLLLGAFGGEERLIDALKQTYRFLTAQPDPPGWMADALCRYADLARLEAGLSDAVTQAQHELQLYLPLLARARTCTCDPRVQAVLDEDAARLGALLLCRGYDEYRSALQTVSFSTLRFASGTIEADKLPVRGRRERVKQLIKEQRGRFVRPAAEETTVLLRAHRVLSALFDLVSAYERAFSSEKRARGVLDFADLEHMALRVLSDADAAREYREAFDCIAVDEYQDSNRLQEALLARIRRADNEFLVGDVKQSIYRFRNAEPGLFLNKLAACAPGVRARVDLTMNFRSGEAILDAVNRVFAAIMTQETAGMAYDARARLTPGTAQPPGRVELHLIEKNADTPDETLDEARDAEVEARLACARIRHIIQNERYTDPATGEERPYRYADFALLLRANTHAQSFARQLSLLGVPCYAQTSGGYFDAREVVLLLNLLRVIDNRRQDVPLLGVLLSPFGGFTTGSLAQLRAAHREGSLFDGLCEAADDGTPEGAAAAAFLDRIARLRRESQLLSVEELLARLMDETGVRAELAAMPGGRQRAANLDALLEKAHAFECIGSRGLYAFLSFMDRAAASVSAGAAQTAAADVVRILSMHKSKGLEYPVVLLCQLGARFNRRDGGAALSLHAEYGAGLRFIDEETGLRTDTLTRRLLARRAVREGLAEELRVLYVGMTRARRRLILIGCMRDAAQMAAAPDLPPSAADVLDAASPLDWLLLGRAETPTVHERAPLLFAETGRRLPPLPAPDPALYDALASHLCWRYPYAAEGRLPARAAVSRLSDPDADVFSMPAFLPPAFADDESTAARRGSLAHLLLQRLPLAPVSQEQLEALSGPLLSRVPAGARDALVRQIARFIGSPLFARLAASPRVEREWPFSYPVPAARVFRTDSSEHVLLQGVIDCCFIEDGAWVLLDYKTDRVAPDTTPEAAAERHAGQLALYAEALESLTGLPVRARIVVLLSVGAAVPV